MISRMTTGFPLICGRHAYSSLYAQKKVADFGDKETSKYGAGTQDNSIYLRAGLVYSTESSSSKVGWNKCQPEDDKCIGCEVDILCLVEVLWDLSCEKSKERSKE